MPVELTSHAEIEAKNAEKLPAFGSLNLLYIKRQIDTLLQLIGREGIFDEYTRHDISHVDKMLAMLEWLVPDSIKRIMSPTDWLLIVLGIYFHDLGMLVTKHEFANRESSGFPEFRDSVLFAGDQGQDYQHKIAALPPEKRERFLYQEFVRERHAERVRWWITGTACSYLGISDQAAAQVDELMKPLGTQFRRDLGFVTESHHLDDLDKLDKYQVSQPYGDSDEETGNLQYAAVLLRVSDLLHITQDRTPAIVFRLINPVDPLSLQEWAKQMAVTRVRSKVGTNEEGDLDSEAPRDTVEIHAYFKKEDGFFGLTAYLGYVANQLVKCHGWISSTHRKNLARHEFPWSKLDDSNIETEGFIRDAFEFTIDQAKILDLLTGHTLYNDSSVVLRELVQNSLDAIKLRLYENHGSAPGEVHISWDSANRVLTVSDNGTGMTQETIRNHLLRVGASLYQDPEFKKTHPGFSSISRFGIGVLSTFMVANSVEIITCHEEEATARRLALRSVHGKYLVSLLNKKTDPAVSVAPHGTTLRLRIRQSAKMPDILKTAKHWILVPRCKVTLEIDNRDSIEIGFDTPRDVLVNSLRAAGLKVAESVKLRPSADMGDQPVCVVQHEIGRVTVAYAVLWSPYFHEWSFLSAKALGSETGQLPIGTCVEGIRVDTDTPGFRGETVIALANACGENSPKTNVARSGLEATPERETLLQAVYRAFCRHAKNEIDNLTKDRGHSLTWAVQEAQYLLSPLVRPELSTPNAHILSRDLLEESLKELPLLLTESSTGREAVSCKSLDEEDVFWTIDCPLFKSAENLIRETPGNASIRAVAKALGSNFELPMQRLLCAPTIMSSVQSLAFRGREITKIVLRPDQRRLDLAWSQKSEPPKWLVLPKRWKDWLFRVMADKYGRYGYRSFTQTRAHEILVLVGGVEIVGIGNETAIRYGVTTLLVGDNPANRYLRSMLQSELKKGVLDDQLLPPVLGVLVLFVNLIGQQTSSENMVQIIKRTSGLLTNEISYLGGSTDAWEQALSDQELMTALTETDWSIFDPSAWERRDIG